jgi:hypothetical protein
MLRIGRARTAAALRLMDGDCCPSAGTVGITEPPPARLGVRPTMIRALSGVLATGMGTDVPNTCTEGPRIWTAVGTRRGVLVGLNGGFNSAFLGGTR